MVSLDYTTLQSTVLSYAVRPELTAEVVQFIRAAEAMIRREVTAIETRVMLTDSDRNGVTSGLYTLPDTIQQVRAIYATGSDGETYSLDNVGVIGIRTLKSDADPQYYAVTGSVLEVRGIPGTGADLEVLGYGWPDPLATTSTNALLTNHEDIYIYGALYHLHCFTQDLELAQKDYQMFEDAVGRLNDLIARKVGGGSTLPAYNFGQLKIGRGY